MKRSTKDKAKGTLHELKGSAKQKVGRVTRNRQLEAEGVAEKIGGKVKRKSAKWREPSRNKGTSWGGRKGRARSSTKSHPREGTKNETDDLGRDLVSRSGRTGARISRHQLYTSEKCPGCGVSACHKRRSRTNSYSSHTWRVGRGWRGHLAGHGGEKQGIARAKDRTACAPHRSPRLETQRAAAR